MSADLVFDTCTYGPESRKLEKDAKHAKLHFSTRKCSSLSPLRRLTRNLDTWKHVQNFTSPEIFYLPLHLSTYPLRGPSIPTRVCTRMQPVTEMRGFVYFSNTLATLTFNTQDKPISMGDASLDFYSFLFSFLNIDQLSLPVLAGLYSHVIHTGSRRAPPFGVSETCTLSRPKQLPWLHR